MTFKTAVSVEWKDLYADIAVSNHIDIDACDIETLDLTAHHPTGHQIRRARVTLI